MDKSNHIDISSGVELVEINDIRSQKEFKGISFSGFKKSDVKKVLIKSLISSKIEAACYWTAELICAGHYADVWDTLLFFYSKHIHLGNPKLAIYLELRIEHFKGILKNGYTHFELSMRNNHKIRGLFAEMICVLCHAHKKHTFDEIKMKKEDFDMNVMADKLKANHTRFADIVFKPEDPRELFIAVNELVYHLSNEGKNAILACFWIEWIIQYETICKWKKEKCICERRDKMPVDSKFQTHIVWIIWDSLLSVAAACHPTLIQKIVKSLLSLYCLKYNECCFKKRKFLIYFAVSLLTEKVSLDIEMMHATDKATIQRVNENLNLIYNQIKENEKSPQTDYLFANIKQSNLEKTIEKLDKMNSFSENFIPRV